MRTQEQIGGYFTETPGSVNTALQTASNQLNSVDLQATVPKIYAADYDVWQYVNRDDIRHAITSVRAAMDTLQALERRLVQKVISSR